VEHAQKL
jgi:hypothetical protein